MWGEINYPLPNFKGCAFQIGEWMSNFILEFNTDDITFQLKSIHVGKSNPHRVV